MHIKEEWMRNGFKMPKLGEVIPHMKMKEARMPFPSGRSLIEVFFWPLSYIPFLQLTSLNTHALLLAPTTIPMGGSSVKGGGGGGCLTSENLKYILLGKSIWVWLKVYFTF